MDHPPEHVTEVQQFRQGETLLLDVFIDDEGVAAEAEKYALLGGGDMQSLAEELATKAVGDVLTSVDGATSPQTDTELTVHSNYAVDL
jgi:hypothetical protein